MSREKLKTFPNDLQLEAPILKATWPFHNVSNVRSRENLKKLYLQDL